MQQLLNEEVEFPAETHRKMRKRRKRLWATTIDCHRKVVRIQKRGTTSGGPSCHIVKKRAQRVTACTSTYTANFESVHTCTFVSTYLRMCILVYGVPPREIYVHLRETFFISPNIPGKQLKLLLVREYLFIAFCVLRLLLRQGRSSSRRRMKRYSLVRPSVYLSCFSFCVGFIRVAGIL